MIAVLIAFMQFSSGAGAENTLLPLISEVCAGRNCVDTMHVQASDATWQNDSGPQPNTRKLAQHGRRRRCAAKSRGQAPCFALDCSVINSCTMTSTAFS